MGFNKDSFLYGIRFVLCGDKRCRDCVFFGEFGSCDGKIVDKLKNSPKSFIPYIRKDFKRCFPKYPKVSGDRMKEIADITITLFNWAE